MEVIMGHTMNVRAIVYAFLAAALYSISSPVSKLFLTKVPATMMASLLYLGAGAGLVLLETVRMLSRRVRKSSIAKENEKKFVKSDFIYLTAMVVLDIAAPILLMIGLKTTDAANVSLLNNFEIVATSIIAFFIFHEKISKRVWMGIGFVTIASMLLSIENLSSFSFSIGSIFVLLACVCWGLENNCTRKLSSNNPIHIVIIKGLGSGTGSLLIAFLLGETFPKAEYLLLILLLGFVAYGLSITSYIFAQRYLGAARTSAYYAIAPFLGAVISFIIFKELPNVFFIVSLLVMAAGTYFISTKGKESYEEK